MLNLSIILAAALPIVPQPTSWTPTEGVCDVKLLNSAVATCSSCRANDLGDEGYQLEISSQGVRIQAATEKGLIWARQTLKQLQVVGKPVPCGTVKDVPKYRVRGFMLDVGRMFQPMDFLYKIARTMSFYKMNTLHIHLNDNEIEKNPKADWSKKYAAFRMECETCPELTAKDGHYTKAEFRKFMKDCAKMGITVIPEFDVPAHSLAFTRVKPEFASKQYGEDHFDLNKQAEILAWLKPIFAEYLTGSDPVFAGPYMHVGTDEYNKREAEKFRAFTDAMLKLVRGFGYRPCAWGALTHAAGSTPVIADRDITMDIWHNPYYQPEAALKAGYTIVSIPDGLTYLVPFAGYYYDFLNCRYLYEHWEPRQVGNYTVPDEFLPQLAGGKFALWNDALGKKKDGSPYTSDDLWARIFPAVQALSEKFWCGTRTGQTWDEFKSRATEKLVP